MREPNKRVSILLSCFNGSELIESYIDSLLNDEIADFCTLIAINFPKSHQNPEFVEQQLQRYPDLILLNQPQTISLYEAWNIGVKQATTEFVSNLNLDDRVSSDYYSFGVDKLNEYKADIFSSFSILTFEIGKKSEVHAHEKHLAESFFDNNGIADYGPSELAGFKNGKLIKRNVPHCAPIWKKQLHDEAGYFNSEQFDFAADYEFWLRCAAANKKFIVSNEFKTLFFSSKGTASDKLQHEDNSKIIDYWQPSFPRKNYQESRLGEWHHKIHHCMNMNCVFSSRKYFHHLSDKLVSVVVVAHENPEFLLQCLNSITAQSYPLFECIVVIDNDPQNTLQQSVQKEFEHDARFVFVGLSDKRERNYCRNLGIELSTGNWVTIVDGDDLLPEHSLAIRIEADAKNQGDIVFGRMQTLAENGNIETIKFADSYRFHDSRISWPTHCTLLLKRDLLSKTRYPASISDCAIDASLIAGEDVKFMFELLKTNQNSKFVNCLQHVYTYRRHFSSSYTKRYNSIQRVINTIISYHGKPSDKDSVYKNTMIERAIGYAFWLGYKLWNEQRISNLVLDADDYILELSKQASATQFEKAEARFITDLKNLDIFKKDETTNLISTIKGLLGGASEIQTQATRIMAKPPQPCTKFNPEKIDYQRLLRWKNKHSGENCILMCNGPSLNKVDFKNIDTKNYVLFGLNKIFLGFENLNISPKYIAAVNSKVLEQSTDTYLDLDVVKFLSNRLSPSVIPQSPFTYFINTSNPPANSSRFSTDIIEYVNEGWTVTHVALQLIYAMGFSNVYIVGMDHKFSQHITGQENQASVIHGNDLDHFHPEYFGQGKSWDLPDIKNSEISYQSALDAFSKAGRNIYDCTIDGACTIFPKLGIDTLYSNNTNKTALKTPQPKPAPIDRPLTQLKETHPKNICYFPAFSHENDLNFSMVRAAWYLGCIPGAKITVFKDQMIESLNVYDYYDPACDSVYKQMRSTGQLVEKPFVKPAEMISELDDSDIIICWKDNAYIEHLLGQEELKKLAANGKKIYRVGAGNQNESSIYIEISKDLSAFSNTLIAYCQKKFEQLTLRLGGKKDAFLFATGPSSNSYHKYRYNKQDSISIICNSVINDEEMLATVQPDILVFADPIFHFGCSTYAKAFREKLLEVCGKYDFEIIIPIKYYPIFTFHMPELKDRVIGIPHYKDKGIILDLNKNFHVNTMSNILSYLMLPVGASLARNLYVIGCDGRPLEEDDYFWGHNTKTQFSGEMQAIKRAHPSFFKVDYNEYYLAHCQNLVDYAEQLENNNQRLYSMWGSHIPALIERLHIPDMLKTNQVVISINPDLRSDFGHWAHYDRRLADTTEHLFVTLTNKKLSINPVEFFAIPTFSDDVFAIKNIYTEESKQRLKDQFSESINRLVGSLDSSTQLNFIMYSGDITYIETLDTVFSRLGPKATFSINLFYSHFDYDVSSGEFVVKKELYEKVLSRAYLRERPWLKLFVDSEKMRSILEQKFDAQVDLWPMVNLDINDRIITDIGPRPVRKEKLVVFPGNGQFAKGFDIACDFILKFGKQFSEKYDCRFVIRNIMRDSSENNLLMQKKLDQIAAFQNVDILEGTLSEEDFLKLFYHADWIVLPYRKRNFYSRTSSCVVNAILSGVPVLVTQDTWLAEQVERFDAGNTFTDNDIDAMFEALCRLAEKSYTARDPAEVKSHYSSSNILPTIT